MSKKEWLKERVFVDTYGRPYNSSDVPMTYMTREEAFIKRGYSKDEINKIYEDTYVMEEEKEYCFNFRGKYEGVEAVSLESAYGYFYSTYPQVSKAELDEAYCGEEE